MKNSHCSENVDYGLLDCYIVLSCMFLENVVNDVKDHTA
jgi:hypothetical protein